MLLSIEVKGDQVKENCRCENGVIKCEDFFIEYDLNPYQAELDKYDLYVIVARYLDLIIDIILTNEDHRDALFQEISNRLERSEE